MDNPEHQWPGILRLVAHQLRTPTSLISGYLDMLATDEIQRDRRRRREILVRVRDSVRELNRLAVELQEASRTAAGTLPIRKKRIAVVAFIEEAVRAAFPLCAYRRVDLQFNRPVTPPGSRMIGDRYYLQMCLLNLIDNAAKYGKQGGHVQVVTRSFGPLVEMRVVDEGSGLGPNALRLFAPFVREQPGQGPDDGIGLGLALVKTIVEAHGGSVTWKSGRPSYVGFRIPMSSN